MQKDIYLSLDRPADISFEGSPAAELFTEEVRQSLEGVLAKNYCTDDDNAGFVSASVDRRPWDGTMWTRDAGVFLRELVNWGYTGRACLTAHRLIQLCARSPEGYYTFPERFEMGKPAYGKEIDGTAAILIGFSLLARRLALIETEAAQTFLKELIAFVSSAESPLIYLQNEAENKTLLSGTGEFGGGMFVDGEYCNVVQNMLAVNALQCWHVTYEELGDPVRGARCKGTSGRLEEHVRRYLVRNGEFLWCVTPGTWQPPEDVMKASANVGFSGINGVGAMISDVLPLKDLQGWWGKEAAVNTFNRLLSSPPRRGQYEKYGMYLQFENFCEGMLTSPSYGQGYAIQLALAAGLKEEAGKMLAFLIYQTCEPHREYALTRESPYWFYERILSPDYFTLPAKRRTVTEGCGALNLVNVAEPMKIARLLAGLNGLKDGEGAAPIFVDGFSAVKVRCWPMVKGGKLKYCDYDMHAQQSALLN